MKVFDRFSNDLVALFTTRHGGVSTLPYDALNVAFHVGDNPENVARNRSLLLQQLPKDAQLFAMEQVHGTAVCTVDAAQSTQVCDALMTQKSHQALMVMVADCIPVLFYDPVHRAVAAVHAGRSGVFGSIVPKTVERLAQSYGTKPHELYVALGPTIGACCYEVGAEIVQEAQTLGYEAMIEARNGRFYLNLLAIVLQQLASIGIASLHIEDHSCCTACRTEDYFSYRKEGTTGRFCGLVMLK